MNLIKLNAEVKFAYVTHHIKRFPGISVSEAYLRSLIPNLSKNSCSKLQKILEESIFKFDYSSREYPLQIMTRLMQSLKVFTS